MNYFVFQHVDYPLDAYSNARLVVRLDLDTCINRGSFETAPTSIKTPPGAPYLPMDGCASTHTG